MPEKVTNLYGQIEIDTIIYVKDEEDRKKKLSEIKKFINQHLETMMENFPCEYDTMHPLILDELHLDYQD